MSFSFIDQPELFSAALVRWQNADVLAIDTEFVRERTLNAQFGLLQVNDGAQVELVDPVSLTNLAPLWQTLNTHSGIQVLHSLGEDVELFWQQGDCLLPKPFDTQVAAAFLDKGQGIGFGALVEQILGVTLEKAQARTNWLQRPLTTEQQCYAAEDVIFLLPLFETLYPQLEQAGLLDWVFAESLRLATRQHAEDAQRYVDVKNAWTLESEGLNVLRTLAAWRYQEAQRRDLATGFVIKDASLIELATARPQSHAQLKKLHILHPQERRIHGDTLLDLIEQAQSVPASHWPAPILRIVDIPEYKVKQQRLSKVIKAIASEMGIPATVLSSKRLLAQYLVWDWQQQHGANSAAPVLLQSWRKPLLEERLHAAL